MNYQVLKCCSYNVKSSQLHIEQFVFLTNCQIQLSYDNIRLGNIVVSNIRGLLVGIHIAVKILYLFIDYLLVKG